MNENKSPFLDETEFFKNNEFVQENKGELIVKAIPTVDKKLMAQTASNTKPVKKEITKFKKEHEAAFKIIQGTVMDIIAKKKASYHDQACVEMVTHWNVFKNKFKYLINKLINYSVSEGQEKIESNYDKTRLDI